jgi:hypothetical protein
MFQHPVRAGQFLSVVIADSFGHPDYLASPPYSYSGPLGLADSKGNTYHVDGGAAEAPAGSASSASTIWVASSVVEHDIQVEDLLTINFASDVPPYASGPSSALHDGIWYSVHVVATAFTDTITPNLIQAVVEPLGLDGERGVLTASFGITPGLDNPGRLATQPDLLLAYFVCGQSGTSDTGDGWHQFLHAVDAHAYPAPGTMGVTPNELFGSWQLATTSDTIHYQASVPDTSTLLDEGYGAIIGVSYRYITPPSSIATTVATGAAVAGVRPEGV